MPNWITKPNVERIEEYRLQWDWKAHPGAGFSFECDKNGVVNVDKLQPEAAKNHAACLTGQIGGDELVGPYLMDFSRDYRNPGSIRCACGAKHHLERGDSCCENCGREFNAVGQELAPRSQWCDDY